MTIIFRFGAPYGIIYCVSRSPIGGPIILRTRFYGFPFQRVPGRTDGRTLYFHTAFYQIKIYKLLKFVLHKIRTYNYYNINKNLLQ